MISVALSVRAWHTDPPSLRTRNALGRCVLCAAFTILAIVRYTPSGVPNESRRAPDSRLSPLMPGGPTARSRHSDWPTLHHSRIGLETSPGRIIMNGRCDGDPDEQIGQKGPRNAQEGRHDGMRIACFALLPIAAPVIMNPLLASSACPLRVHVGLNST